MADKDKKEKIKSRIVVLKELIGAILVFLGVYLLVVSIGLIIPTTEAVRLFGGYLNFDDKASLFLTGLIISYVGYRLAE